MPSDLLEIFYLFFYIILFIVIGYLLIAAVILLIMTICFWALFKRADEPGWISFVPIYNLFTINKIAFGDYRWALTWLALFALRVVMAIINMVLLAFSEEIWAEILAMVVMSIGFVVGIGLFAVSCITLYFFGKAYGYSTFFCIMLLLFSPILLIAMALDKDHQYVGYSDFGWSLFDKLKSKQNKSL